MLFNRLDLVGRGVNSFRGMEDLADRNFVVVNCAQNNLTSFQSFSTHPYLVELDVRHNKITSFYGLTKQRALQTLALEGNPIAAHPLYRVMALMVIGFSITTIDQRPVSPQERTLARELGSHAAIAVSYGWLMDLRPRPAAAYRDIIAECRHAQTKIADQSPAVSVTTALSQLAHSVKERSERDDARSQEKTIARLSRRVALLEHSNNSHAPGGVIVSKVGAMCHTSRAGNELVADGSLSLAELKEAKIVYSDGIAARTNLVDAASQPERATLQLGCSHVVVQRFFTGQPIIELDLEALVLQYRQPRTLILSDNLGAMLELRFDYLDTLQSVFKALFVLRALPVPSFSFLSGESGPAREAVPVFVLPEQKKVYAIEDNHMPASIPSPSEKSQHSVQSLHMVNSTSDVENSEVDGTKFNSVETKSSGTSEAAPQEPAASPTPSPSLSMERLNSAPADATPPPLNEVQDSEGVSSAVSPPKSPASEPPPLTIKQRFQSLMIEDSDSDSD